MSNLQNSGHDRTKEVIDISIRLLMLAALLYSCYQFVEPFIQITVWSIIFAVATFPLFLILYEKTKRKVLSAVLIAVVLIIILLLPGIFFINTLIDAVHSIKEYIANQDQIEIKPSERIKEIPIVGETIYNNLLGLNDHFSETIKKYSKEIKAAGGFVLDSILSIGLAYFKFLAAIIIATIIQINYKSSIQLAENLFVKLVGEHGSEFSVMAANTIGNVVKGIIGVALIQSLAMGIAFAIAGIPGVALWTFLMFILCIAQLGTTLVAVPVLIYAYINYDLKVAIALTVWSILVGLSDNVLKPIFLGKGAMVPMLVIFIGAIGGFMHSGIIGLFTGAILISIFYKLFLLWLDGTHTEEKPSTLPKNPNSENQASNLL